MLSVLAMNCLLLHNTELGSSCHNLSKNKPVTISVSQGGHPDHKDGAARGVAKSSSCVDKDGYSYNLWVWSCT